MLETLLVEEFHELRRLIVLHGSLRALDVFLRERPARSVTLFLWHGFVGDQATFVYKFHDVYCVYTQALEFVTL